MTTPFTGRLLLMLATDMKRRGRSQRAMAELLEVHHSTLSRWFQNGRLDGTSVDCIVAFLGTQQIIDNLRRDGLDRALRGGRGDAISACPIASSVTGQPCLLPEGHPQDSPSRFHRYAPLPFGKVETERMLREAEHG